MRQIKPTSLAQTHVLDPAHPSQRVGEGVEGLALQLNRNFSQTERLQLSEVARLSNRLASLMRVQLLLQGPQSSGLAEDLISALGAFAEQMAKEENND